MAINSSEFFFGREYDLIAKQALAEKPILATLSIEQDISKLPALGHF